jgi:hypothetical protein
VTFIDPDREFKGRQALSDQAQRFLTAATADFVFEEDGRPDVGTGTAAHPDPGPRVRPDVRPKATQAKILGDKPRTSRVGNNGDRCQACETAGPPTGNCRSSA